MILLFVLVKPLNHRTEKGVDQCYLKQDGGCRWQRMLMPVLQGGNFVIIIELVLVLDG